jgi:hypothetical protein
MCTGQDFMQIKIVHEEREDVKDDEGFVYLRTSGT